MRHLTASGLMLLPSTGHFALTRSMRHAAWMHSRALRTCVAALGKYTDEERVENAQYQAEVFSKPEQLKVLDAKQPEHVLQRLREIVAAVPNLGADSRVLDVGSGTGPLIPILQERGVQDILASDLADKMLEVLRNRYPANPLGNEKGVRTWLGGVESLPAFQGPFDAAFFNSVFGNILDQREALLCTALLLKPGGHIVISHPLGSKWLEGLRQKDPQMVPHPLPDRATLEQLIWDLPLEVANFRDEDSLYIALLKVPEGFGFQGAPVVVEEEVVTGFGRGSRQMGVPTANLKPQSLFAGPLNHLPLGVYFGWAQLQGAGGEDGEVQKTVLNIGKRPTIDDGDQRTVELHILHKYSRDFYGARLKAVIVGFIRPEVKFAGLDALIGRIKADIGIARKQLDLPVHSKLASHESFKQ